MKSDQLNTAAIDDAHRSRLFLLSCIALVTSAMVFSIGASIAGDLIRVFDLSATALGLGLGAWSLGFAIAVFLGSPLCDTLGMGRLLSLAAVCHLVGTVMMIFAQGLTGALGGAEQVIYVSGFIAGVGSGLVEAVINPLIATLYSDNKTHKLNVLHAWWPAGIVIGSVLAYVIQQSGAGGDNNWQIRLATILLPGLVYLVMTFGQRFPATERVQAQIPASTMIQEAFKPLFVVLFLMMFLTAALELAPGRWVDAMLTRSLNFPGILVLAYVNGLMFLFRFFAGPLAHRFSPIGLMWLSSLLAGIGLFLLSRATSPVMALLAATVWGIGVCYMWPTMLGIASERFPKGGAFVIGLMGTAGQLSIQLVLPWMGKIYDNAVARLTAQGMGGEAAKTAAGPIAFQQVSQFALILIVVFGAIWLMDKSKGGYKVEKI